MDGLLVRALRDMQLRDGGVPQDLLDVAAPVHRAAVEFRENALVMAGSGTSADRIGSGGRSSVVTSERLSVQEAARITGYSESFVRRLARKGVLSGTRTGPGIGTWQLDGGSLAVLMADRRDRHREAA
ncbi:helix-turn-helix domain-containing protein [Streptomyces mirabilis]|uniref:helix-turn-helix domain-containing protein n=1 Tax=Streptomyces mirabilis TaxID=68239 RepID=UPI0036786A2E